MSAVSAKSFQSLINVCPKTVQYLLIICTKFLLKICSKSAQNLLKNRIESFLNLSKKLTKYSAIWHNMFKICGILVQKLSRSFKICLNCVQHNVHILSNIRFNSAHSMITISKNVCHHPTKSVQYMLINCTKFVENLYKFRPKSFKVCRNSVQDMCKICSKST